jgi:hypothetical protein
MRVVPLAAVSVLLVVALSACSFSHHRYSVRQVEAAFASQGIRLHKTVLQEAPGFVVLRYGRRPHFITVGVRTRAKQSGFVYFAGSRRARLTRRGNVVAISDAGDLAAVRSALAELH